MDAYGLVMLGHSYFKKPGYSVAQEWSRAILLYPINIEVARPNGHCHFKFFPEVIECSHSDNIIVSCHWTVLVLDTPFHFIVITFFRSIIITFYLLMYDYPHFYLLAAISRISGINKVSVEWTSISVFVWLLFIILIYCNHSVLLCSNCSMCSLRVVSQQTESQT